MQSYIIKINASYELLSIRKKIISHFPAADERLYSK